MIRAHVAVRKNTRSATVLNMPTLWFVVAALATLGLAAYALFLWRKVWRHQQQLNQQRAEQKQQRRDDLIVLTNSFLTEQMPWAEGCIRIKVILDHYDAELGMQADYQVLHTVFDATQNIPTHQAWRDLSSTEKLPFTRLLSELELQHKQASISAVKQLLSHLNR